MSTIAVGAITDESGGTTATINSYTPTASNMAGRNRIINGDMRIDQRNAGAAVTVGTGSNFVVDRFTSTNTTATGTITGQQATLGNSKSIKLTATAAVTDLTTNKYVYGVKHRPEAQNVFDLNGKSVTFSFKVETNWAGNLPVAVLNSAFNRSYVVDTAIVSGTNTVSITLPMEAATVAANDNSVGLEITIGFNNEATYRTATTGSWIAGLFWVSTSSTQWTKTINNYINVTEVQLEEGSAATPFEHRSYGTELALCQRYLPAFNGTGYIGQGFAYSTTQWVCMMPSIVTPRTTPTGLTVSSSAHFNFSNGSLGEVVCSTITLATPQGEASLFIGGTVASGLTAGQSGMLRSLSGGQLLFTGCEL